MKNITGRDRIFSFSIKPNDLSEKLPPFENYSRRFNSNLSQNAHEKLAFHYYIQQSMRNILRRIVHQPNRLEAIKHVLQTHRLLPPSKDVTRTL